MCRIMTERLEVRIHARSGAFYLPACYPTTVRGAPCAPRSMRRERPRVGRTSRPRELCTTIPDDRGDESFADDLNMGRGIVSGRVALLLRSTEIPPHRPKDFPTPPHSRIPLPCLASKNKVLWPRENILPRKKIWALRAAKKGEGSRVRVEGGGERRKEKREKHLGGKPIHILTSPRTPSPPGLGQTGPGGRDPRAQDARFTVIFGGE